MWKVILYLWFPAEVAVAGAAPHAPNAVARSVMRDVMRSSNEQNEYIRMQAIVPIRRECYECGRVKRECGMSVAVLYLNWGHVTAHPPSSAIIRRNPPDSALKF